MSRRALFGVVVCLFVIGGRGLSAATGPVATVQLTEGWATFGQAVPQGMAPVGSGLQIGGLPTQTDVKNRWPDGSIRFAVVTAKVPPGGGSYQINAGTLNAGTFIPAPQTAVVSLNISGCLPTPGPACPGGLHTAALPAAGIRDMAGSVRWCTKPDRSSGPSDRAP